MKINGDRGSLKTFSHFSVLKSGKKRLDAATGNTHSSLLLSSEFVMVDLFQLAAAACCATTKTTETTATT